MTAAAYSSALYRTLRDIADGHITLRVDIDRYDPHTGRPLDSPRVGDTTADRLPPMSLPNAGGEWWNDLAEQGWIRLPAEGEARVWHLTDAGRQWLADHNKEQPDA